MYCLEANIAPNLTNISLSIKNKLNDRVPINVSKVDTNLVGGFIISGAAWNNYLTSTEIKKEGENWRAYRQKYQGWGYSRNEFENVQSFNAKIFEGFKNGQSEKDKNHRTELLCNSDKNRKEKRFLIWFSDLKEAAIFQFQPLI